MLNRPFSVTPARTRQDLDHTPAYFEERNKLWFGGAKETDTYIREHFEADVVKAVKGDYDSWLRSPKGCMALIILLDQFSLNLYREQPKSYDQSRISLPIVRRVIEKGWQFVLTPAERVFLYLPLEHSEKIEDQKESVERFRFLLDATPQDIDTAMQGYLDYAVRHFIVVDKFGRFPDRNEVYGRKSTPEEEKFLASDAAPF